ncbi:hypothetical protein PSEG_00070 [Pseudomonas sp. Nvir]|nr:hypothetical protein PSNVIR_02097 [Pseudomonas sp. Nvir]
MCRDGPQSGPGNVCIKAEILGPLRGPSRHKAAPTRIRARFQILSISTSLVSFRQKIPTTKLMPVTRIGYQSP